MPSKRRSVGFRSRGAVVEEARGAPEDRDPVAAAPADVEGVATDGNGRSFAAVEATRSAGADQDAATGAAEEVVVLAAAGQVVGSVRCEAGVRPARPKTVVGARPAGVRPVVVEARLGSQRVVGIPML